VSSTLPPSVHTLGRVKRPCAVLLLVGLAGGVLASCGSSSPAPVSANTTTSGAPATPAGGSSAGNTASAPGVTPTSITIGQVDDLSSPIPGLFKDAQIGTQAYVDYVNSQGGVNGRKLILDARDTAFNAATAGTLTQTQVQQDFALVGGFSLVDAAEQPVLDATHTPDVAVGLSPELANDPNVWSATPSPTTEQYLAYIKYFAQKFPTQVKSVGVIYTTATPASVDSAKIFIAAAQANGWKVTYQRGFGPAEFTFTADVVKMKSAGVKLFISFVTDAYGATFAKEFQQADFNPIHVEVGSYGSKLVSSGGPAVNGMYLPGQTALYLGEDAKVVPEVALFDKWHAEAGASTPIALWGADGWMSGALFVQALRNAGQNPTRASLKAALDKITNFTDNGMIAGSNPAAAQPPACFVMAQVQNGVIRRIPPTPAAGFICNNAGFYRTPAYHPMVRG
jgi:ABC-type branched-subunit amino acid transport system substrate-binding protein